MARKVRLFTAMTITYHGEFGVMLYVMKRQLSRRGLIGRGAALAAAPALSVAAPTMQRDFLKELGVRPIINGAGVYTFSTASLMRPEVVDAIRAISTKFVRLG